MVEVLTGVSWIIDAGALVYFARIMARNGTHWQGAPTVITMMTLVTLALMVSGAMVFVSETRSSRMTALAIAGILPLLAGAAFGAVGIAAAVASLFGGRMN